MSHVQLRLGVLILIAGGSAAGDNVSETSWPRTDRLPELRQRLAGAEYDRRLAAAGDPGRAPILQPLVLRVDSFHLARGGEKAGLAIGDVLVACDGRPFRGRVDLPDDATVPRRLSVVDDDGSTREVIVPAGRLDAIIEPLWLPGASLRRAGNLEDPGSRLLMVASSTMKRDPDLAETCLRRAQDVGCNRAVLLMLAARCAQKRAAWADSMAFAAAAWDLLPADERIAASQAVADAAAMDGRPDVALAAWRRPGIPAVPAEVTQLERMVEAIRSGKIQPRPDGDLGLAIAALPVEGLPGAPPGGRRVKLSHIPYHPQQVPAGQTLFMSVDPAVAAAECQVEWTFRYGKDADREAGCPRLEVGVQEAHHRQRLKFWLSWCKHGVGEVRRLDVPDAHILMPSLPTDRPFAVRLIILGSWCEIRVDGKCLVRTPILDPIGKRRYYGFYQVTSGIGQVGDTVLKTVIDGAGP